MAEPAGTMDGVSFRPACPRDVPSFLGVYRAVAAEKRFIRSEQVSHAPRVYRRRFRRSWTDEEAHIVAVVGDRVIGHLGINREDHPVTRHVATLGMAVASEWRGKGVGNALMHESLRWAREVGVEKVLLSVYPGNAAAIGLYRKFGFTEEGRLVRQSRKSYGYEDEILMARWMGSEETA